MARTTGRSSSRREPATQQIDALRRELQRSQRALEVLYNISLSCRKARSFREICEATYYELTEIFELDACYIALCDESDPDYFHSALMVDEGAVDFDTHVQRGVLTNMLILERAPLLFGDLQGERERLPEQPYTFGNAQRLSRSWLGVPFLNGDEVVGAISIQSYTPYIYNETDRDLLQHIANVVAVSLANMRLAQHQQELSEALVQQVEARTRELAGLSAITAEMVLQFPLPRLLDRALRLGVELLHADAGNVRLLDEQLKALVLIAQRGFNESYVQNTAVSALESSPIRSVVLENRPQVVTNNLQALPGRRPLNGFEAVVSVPLRIGSRVLGTLSLFTRAGRSFSDPEIGLVQAIGDQIAIAVENARLLEERERQIAELRILGAVSRAATTALDLPTLLSQVHDALAGFLRIDAFTMLVVDPERDVISSGLSIDEGQQYTHWGNQPPPRDSLAAWILRNRKPLHFTNLPEQIGAYPALASHVIGSGRQAIAWLGVPLFDRDNRAIGMIAIQSYRPAVFGERDLQLLTGIARQVALHVQNVRLLSQRERQIRDLDAIGQIGQLVAASYDLDEMFDGVYRTLMQAVEAGAFYLLICEMGSHVITNAIFIEEGVRTNAHLPGGRPAPGSLTDWILRYREPLLFVDIAHERDRLQRMGVLPSRFTGEYEIHSWVGVPLLARDGEPIGVISLQDNQPYRYDDQTIELLRQVASHVSLGVQKVRLFEERERQVEQNARLFAEAQAHAEAVELQAQRMALVHRISSLMSSRLDQDEIFAIAGRELVSLFWADHVGIMLFDEEMRYGTVVAEYPPTGALGIRVQLFDNPIMNEFRSSRRPVCISSIDDDERAIMSREALHGLGVRSTMILPLVSRDRVIGSIGLDSMNEVRSFTEEEQDLFLTVAAAIAAAIENARLFAAEQEARRTADTLREVARVLSATFDPDEVLQLILGELHKVIAYDTASIMLLENDTLRIAACRGWLPGEEPRGLVFPLGESAAGEAVRERRPIVTADTSTSPHWQSSKVGLHIRAWLGVPLITRGAVLGVLNIDSCEAHRFTERDISVAEAFARHAAVALENARLYQDSVTRVEQEMEIARQIQSNLFPKELPEVAGLCLDARCLPARETGGDFYDVVPLSAGRVGIIVGDVSGKSLPAAMLMAVARSVARSEARNHERPDAVMRSANHWIVRDVPPHTFVALNYATLDANSRRLVLAGAGQLAPLLRRSDGSLRYLETPPPSFPLGIAPHMPYTELTVMLEPGDTIVFYTDGIVEAHGHGRSLFGFEAFEALVREYGHLSPPMLIEHIFSAVYAFIGESPQHDDMTVLVARVV